MGIPHHAAVEEIVDGFTADGECMTMAEKMQAEAALNRRYAKPRPVLVDENGQRIRAKLIRGKYGPCWAMLDSTGGFTGKFFSKKSVAARGWREVMAMG